MNTEPTLAEKPTFFQQSARAELSRLQGELALHRGVLRSQRRGPWEPDRYWQVKKVHALEETKVRIRESEIALGNFIDEHCSFLGAVSNHGRLCWDSYLGGQPIDLHYCQLDEWHPGAHANYIGQWDAKPKHAGQKLDISKPRKITAEKLMNLRQFGTEWGKRGGPSILIFRDTHWHRHPVRRAYSCQGCQHLRINEEYGSATCAHPEFIRKHEVPQSVAAAGPKYLLTPACCPALGDDAHLTQPHPCPLQIGSCLR